MHLDVSTNRKQKSQQKMLRSNDLGKPGKCLHPKLINFSADFFAQIF